MDFIPFVKKGTVRVFIEDEETKKEQLLTMSVMEKPV